MIGFFMPNFSQPLRGAIMPIDVCVTPHPSHH